MRTLFLTFFYSGKASVAPGTFGTLAAVPFALVLLNYFPPSTLFLMALFITVFSVKIINNYEEDTGIHDDKHIVIDEVAGVFIAISVAPGLMIPFSAYAALDYPLLIPALLSVVYFRVFDIWKPSFIGRIDRELKGGWGVMLDDVAAGCVAGISSAVTWEMIQKVF